MTAMRIPLLLAHISALVGCAVSPPRPVIPMAIVPIESATFRPVSPTLPDGAQMAVLWGDPSAGPSAVLLKLKKGSTPLHTHSSDYHLVVLKGIAKHWSEGQSEVDAKPLGPGSYWFQPGNQVHGDSCLTEECLVHVIWSGVRDGKLASVKP